MAKMNYNRPNGGYESEPWRKTYAKVAAPKLTPLPVRTHRDLGHSVKIVKTKNTVHKMEYRCIKCNKHLAWAPK
jgi:hypothetical protein